MTLLSEKNLWKLLKAYYDANSIVNIQLDSFNHFVNFTMQEIVDQNSEISVTIGENQLFTVNFGQISLGKPQIIEEDRKIHDCYPYDARRLDLTYDAPIYCDIKTVYINGDNKEENCFPRETIGRLPIMIGSENCNLSNLTMSERMDHRECENDPGGYFIIRGHERVIVSAVRANYNQVFVLNDKEGGYSAEVRSMSNETAHSALVKASISSDGRTIEFSLPSIKEKNKSKQIPVGVVFKALGYNTIEEMSKLINVDHPDMSNIMNYIYRDSFFCSSTDEALDYIGKYAMHTISPEKERIYAQQVVENELFPHLGVTCSKKEHAHFLGYILNKLLLTHFGKRMVDDRDNYGNKRVEVCGVLIAEIFRNLFKKYVLTIKTQIEKRKQKPDIRTIIHRIKSITEGILYCMSRGDWSVQKNATFMKTGVSQILDRMTYMSSISHTRRVLLHVATEAKNAEIRQIHSSQYGYLCPSETPEGSKVGIVLNFAITTSVTNHIPQVIVRKVLNDFKNIQPIEDIDFPKNTRVLLNNIIIGYTDTPYEVIKQFKSFRSKRIIPNGVSISYNEDESDIKIYSDEGRLIRPLLSLKDNKLAITEDSNYDWTELVKENIVQYVDCSESENSVIAMFPKDLNSQISDYCEIHPCCMLGIVAMCTPFSDHSQSPRNCYQASMGKQGIGIPTLCFNHRFDTILHIMNYPQRPLTSTKFADIFGVTDMPAGVNLVVAIMPFYGFNQEDSIIAHAGAINRGILDISSYHTISGSEDEKRDGYTQNKICKPPRSSQGLKEGQPGYFKRKNGNYSLLDDNGVIKERTKSGAVQVKAGDVIIGKVVITSSKTGGDTMVDASRIIQVGEEGVIDRVYTTITPNGYTLVKIVIRQTRRPIPGDKLASRAAQKGTIGAIIDTQDMPFIATGRNAGVIPDILINPLCMPSRMTINQIISCLLSKICVVSGDIGDATPFTENSHNIAEKLVNEIDSNPKRYNFTSDGLETMINGKTGEEIKSKIFVGPTYYQRLKHMVQDKMHARARGLVTALTRQPLEGRSRMGGLRFGEMERDCMISHGASAMLVERLFGVSDPFQIPVCKDCGIITSTFNECQKCHCDRVVLCKIPYASKQMFKELECLGLEMRICPSE